MMITGLFIYRHSISFPFWKTCDAFSSLSSCLSEASYNQLHPYRVDPLTPFNRALFLGSPFLGVATVLYATLAQNARDADHYLKRSRTDKVLGNQQRLPLCTHSEQNFQARFGLTKNIIPATEVSTKTVPQKINTTGRPRRDAIKPTIRPETTSPTEQVIL